MSLYILDSEKRPVRAASPMEAEAFYSVRENMRVAETTLDDGRWVSTVFLGTDSDFCGLGSVFFETMVFASKENLSEAGYMKRHATWADAEHGHAKAIEWCAANPVGDPLEGGILDPERSSDANGEAAR